MGTKNKTDSVPKCPMRVPPSPRVPSSFQSIYLSSTHGNEAIKVQAKNPAHGSKTFSRQQPLKDGRVEMPVRRASLQSRSMRIPSAFQSVYLSSNSGNEAIEHTTEAPISLRSAFPKKQNFNDVPLKMPPRTDRSSVSKFFMELDESSSSTTDSETSFDDSVSHLSLELHDVMERKSSMIDAQDQTSGQCDISPKEYLDALLKSRGYRAPTKKATETGYLTEPTLLQKTSYHPRLINIARDGQNNKLRSIMTSGISLNPCNAHGESLLHIVSRRGKPETLQVLLDCGSSVQTCDNIGRTLLHEACLRAAPCFETIDLIANKDLNLFHLADNRGFTPLFYVNKKYWNKWIHFIESKKDTWWPHIKSRGRGRRSNAHPELLETAPKTRIMSDPENALDLKLAEMVLKGVISPKEAILLNQDDDSSEEEEDEDYGDDFSECPSLVDFTCRTSSIFTESSFFTESTFSDNFCDDDI